jgi:hypothetical protein
VVEPYLFVTSGCTLSPFTFGERPLGMDWIGGWVGVRAFFDAVVS